MNHETEGRETKTCSTCKRNLPLSAFYPCKNGPKGRRSACIQCGNELKKIAYRKKNPKIFVNRDDYRKKEPDLTDNYIRMLLLREIKEAVLKIPYELIEVKREEIRINRELLRIKNGEKPN